jgi:hypothetical protein
MKSMVPSRHPSGGNSSLEASKEASKWITQYCRPNMVDTISYMTIHLFRMPTNNRLVGNFDLNLTRDQYGIATYHLCMLRPRHTVSKWRYIPCSTVRTRSHTRTFLVPTVAPPSHLFFHPTSADYHISCLALNPLTSGALSSTKSTRSSPGHSSY